MRVGILALQGAVEPHREKLLALGADVVLVRNKAELAMADSLILPGGESTAMVLLAKEYDLWSELKTFASTKPCWGVCAGAILLANHVTHPASQESLGAIDMTVERNAFGRQADSFIDSVDLVDGPAPKVEGVFIRAPRFQKLGESVIVLGTWKGEAVHVEQGLVRASSFHPELGDDLTLHRDFIKKCQRNVRGTHG